MIFSEEDIRRKNHNEDGTELTDLDVVRIVEYFGGQIIKWSTHLEDILNRYIVISGRHMNTVYTKIRFGKFNRNELLNDIATGRKNVYGAIWDYGLNNEPSLKSVAVMKPDGGWKLL